MRELSEKEYQKMRSNSSVKKRYDKKKGQEVSLDRFLFACHDTSKQLIEIDQRYREKTFWPQLLEDLSTSNLETSIEEMIAWYKSQFLVLSKPGALDIGRLSQVAKCLAYLEKDFKSLVKIISGRCLEDHLLDQYDLTPPWTYLKSDLTKYFDKTGEKIWAYFNWAYGISPPDQIVNESEIPPASLSYGHNKDRTSFNRNKPARRSNKNGYKDYREGSKSTSTAKSNNKYSKKSRNHQNNKSGQSPTYRSSVDNYNTSQKRKFRRKSLSEGDKIKQKQALLSVDEAIKKLEKGGIKEIVLSPQNSFYRRMQHKHAIKRGFNSKSTGDDNSRAVKIIKQD